MKIKIISENIITNTVFSNCFIYVIAAQVHVLKGVSLTIDNGTTILIQNGTTTVAPLFKNALIFDTGSKLYAYNVYFKACDSAYNPQKLADNGGLWLIGSSSKGDKDGINFDFNPTQSFFCANKIFLEYLGCNDPTILPTNDNDPPGDDLDAISILGVGSYEWDVKGIKSMYSGDDGVDIENSQITLEKLSIHVPNEDGLNMSSSILNVTKCIKIKMVTNQVRDRDIFDFEADDGPSILRFPIGTKVYISGIFGDQLTLVSNDLPQPTNQGNDEYLFKGFTTQGQTFVYAGLIPDPND